MLQVFIVSYGIAKCKKEITRGSVICCYWMTNELINDWMNTLYNRNMDGSRLAIIAIHQFVKYQKLYFESRWQFGLELSEYMFILRTRLEALPRFANIWNHPGVRLVHNKMTQSGEGLGSGHFQGCQFTGRQYLFYKIWVHFIFTMPKFLL